jgi:hypothetical protein
MEKKNLIILIILGFIIFILGGGLGILYQQQKEVLPSKDILKVQAVQTLSSKVIPSIAAFGTVTNISGRNLTLVSGNDSLTVKISDGAQIFLPATTTTDKNGKVVTSPQQAVSFSEIKNGNNVSVNLKLLPDGQIEGQMVSIITAK